MKSVTIEEIAREAGVTSATVSKALNNKPDIGLPTRKRIQRIAREMGYSANMAARALARAKTMAIGVVIAFPQIPTVIERLTGIQEAASSSGYQALVTFHNGSMENEIQQIQLLKGRVDGIILTPANHQVDQLKIIRVLSIPFVLMSESLPGVETDYVGMDDEEGGRLAAVHLLEQKHHHVAYFASAAHTPSDAAILRGIKKAFSSFDASFDTRMVYWNNQSRDITRSNLDRMLSKRTPITAVIAFSDMTALWVIERLRELGVRVPDDMAVVGFDNIEIASLGNVPITSIAQPNYEVGRQAATVLLDRIKSGAGSDHARRIIFTPKLIVRESSLKTPPVHQPAS